ncbi:MAG TPA: FtsX-like permease family protein [Trebonia sp.]
MIKIILQSLLARKRRLVTTALAVIIGVAFTVGTLMLTDSMSKVFNDLSAGVYKGTDAVVRAKTVFNDPAGDQRPLIDASLVPALSRVPGVAAAQGIVDGYAQLIGKDGTPVGTGGAPALGGNWGTVPALNPFQLVAGHAPQAADEVVIDKHSATSGHLTVGDTTTVLLNGPPQRVRIAGIAVFGTANSPAGASVVLFTTPVAERLVTAPGKFTSISFAAVPGVSQQQLVNNLQRVLPPGTEAVTGTKIIQETKDSFQQILKIFSSFLLIFAVVALVVGGFIIMNTFAITVAQRTQENGLLRALGASRRQVLGSVLAEAVAIGAIAAVIGLAAGVAVATGLKALLGAFGFGLPGGSLVLSANTVVVSLLLGLGVTVVAAISPARKAAKVPPVAAMQQATVGSTGYGSKQRIVVGLTLLAVGIAVLFYGLFGHPAKAFLIVGAGILLVFFGMTTLSRTIALPLSRAIGAPLPAALGVTGTLARENTMRNPKRTASSASALMIGVGLVAFITTLASSTTASTNATIDRTFTGDFVITGANMGGGVDPALPAKLDTLPQVAAATGKSFGDAVIFGQVEGLAAVDPGTAGQIFNVSPVQGSISALGLDGIAVSQDTATKHHLKLGDPVPILFRDTGPQTLRVALIYGDPQAAPSSNPGSKPSYFLGTPAFNANFAAPHSYDQVFVKKAPGVSSAAALAAIKQLTARDAPGATVQDQAGYKAQQASQVNQLLYFIYALLALAILIALLGIGNTLALSIFERTRELGVMRAVGMTRHQLRRTIRWESVIIALQGTFLGLLVGVFFSWALVLAQKNQGLSVFSVPFRTLLLVIILAGLAGVAAAILPSRRAAKLNVLRAIVTE